MRLNKLKSPIYLLMFIFMISIAYSLTYAIIVKDNPLKVLLWYRLIMLNGFDYFYSIAFSINRIIVPGHPYPPLCYALYYALGKISDINTDNPDIIAMSPQAQLIFNIYNVLISIFIYLLINNFLLNNNISKRKSNIISFLLLLSYFCMYSFMFGNDSFLILPMILYYVFNYNSNIKYKSELSIILLAIASAIKLSPAVFGLLLLTDKKYFEAVKLFLYFVVINFLSMLFIKHESSLLEVFFKVLTNIKGYNSQFLNRIGGGRFLIIPFELLSKISNISIDISFFANYVSKILFILLIPCTFVLKKKWEKVACICYSIPLLSTMTPHICVIFIIPIIFFIIEEKEICTKNIYIYLLLISSIIYFRFPLFGHYALDYRIRLIIVEYVDLLIVLYLLIKSIRLLFMYINFQRGAK